MSDGNVNYFKNEFREGIDEREGDFSVSGENDCKGMKYAEENEEVLQPVLLLLEKAEQILSILNLSNNTIVKYNQLKKLTFEKLLLEFKPLTKQGSSNQKSQNIPLDNFWNLILKERKFNNKKNEIIEFLIELIEKFVLEFNGCNDNYLRKFLQEKENYFNRQFDQMINDRNNKTFEKNFEDADFELKIEEIKIKEFLNKSEISYKKFLSNLSLKNSIYKLPTCDTSKENYVIENLENKIEEMKKFHEIEMKEYKERFTDLRIKYNPDLENQLQETVSILEEIKEMVHPVYEKYASKNSNWYHNEKKEFKYKEIEEINFLICLTNKFFNDNKYLIEILSTLQKEKGELLEEREMPFVENAISRNNHLRQISEDYKILEKNSISLYDNFKELIEFINKNVDSI